MEVRIESKNIKISDVRSSFSKMNLGDLNVKEFGKPGDYLIKFEKKLMAKMMSLKKIKENVVNKLGIRSKFLEELKMLAQSK